MMSGLAPAAETPGILAVSVLPITQTYVGVLPITRSINSLPKSSSEQSLIFSGILHDFHYALDASTQINHTGYLRETEGQNTWRIAPSNKSISVLHYRAEKILDWIMDRRIFTKIDS